LYLYLFFNLGTRWEWVVNPRERDLVRIVQEDMSALVLVWTGAENFIAIRI
jgi:hypothetical protein